MSISTVLKSRLLWGVVLGFIAGGLFAPPQFVAAQTRTSLASLQAQVDSLLATVASLQSNVTSLQTTTVSKAQLSASGTINNSSNPVDWSQLKNVPPGFADGADDTLPSGDVNITGNLTVTGTINGDGGGLTNVFTVGSGLSLTGKQISVNFGTLDARYVNE